jgi:hypothetical protein
VGEVWVIFYWNKNMTKVIFFYIKIVVSSLKNSNKGAWFLKISLVIFLLMFSCNLIIKSYLIKSNEIITTIDSNISHE